MGTKSPLNRGGFCHLCLRAKRLGSRYPNDDTTSAWDAIEALSNADVEESTIAHMLGSNAAQQFGIELGQKVRS